MPVVKVPSETVFFLNEEVPSQLIFALFTSIFLFVVAFSKLLEDQKSSLDILRTSKGFLLRQFFIISM